MKNNNLKEVSHFTFLFILSALLTIVATIFIEVVVGFILFNTGVFEEAVKNNTLLWIIVMIISGSIIIGVFLSVLFSRFILNPVNKLIDGINRLSSGKYKTQIYLGKNHMVKNLADSFNSLANELDSTELLRSDFTNTISHELKTPIVSIYGFAKVLNSGELSPEKQKEYLEIIETEAKRLSDMAMGILNLTKIEKQEILTEKRPFNLSEQVRTAILLSEKAWAEKKLEFNLDFDEITIVANESLLQQVWINVIDNAIKFSKPETVIDLSISQTHDLTTVKISDVGKEISPDDLPKIFNKFYQADSSRSTHGNGIGLSLVKKIVSLHGGEVVAESHDGVTTFTITLPNS
ncbi:MAG: HAMP domain-containing histidine kinase [Clostridiales bacterium]|nr:HAMP domain-containing histidine kinase [Clostridiales bacterium]